MSISIHYVYAHIKDGTIVYIGKGKNERAWHTKRKNKDHENWAQQSILDGTWGSSIQILKSGLSSKTAFELEKELIETHKPLFNSVGNTTKICKVCGFRTNSITGYTSHMSHKHSDQNDTQ